MTIGTFSDAIVPVIKSIAHAGCELAKDPQFQSTMMVGVGILTGIVVSKVGKEAGKKVHSSLPKTLPGLCSKVTNNQRLCKNICSIGAQIAVISAIGCFAAPFYGAEIVSGMILSSVGRAEWESLN